MTNDTMSLVTAPSSTYIPVTRGHLTAICNQLKIPDHTNSKYLDTLTLDIANLASGGTMLGVDELRCNVGADGLGRCLKRQAFLSSLDIKLLADHSPLTTALLIRAALAKDVTDDGKSPTKPGKVNKAIAAIARIKKGTVEALKAVTDSTSQETGDTPGGSEQSESGNEVDTQLVKLVAKYSTGVAKIEEIDGVIDQMAPMRVYKHTEVKPTPDGTDRIVRQIKGLSEYHKIVSSEYGLPRRYRIYRALSRESQVRERVDITAKKQLLYMLIDVSGSMLTPVGKVYCVGGLMVNRLKAVKRGDAELWISYFAGRASDPIRAVTPTEADTVLARILDTGLYNGGCTKIDEALRHAIKNIEIITSTTGTERPSLVILTDAESSSISVTTSDLCGIVLHSFILPVDCKKKRDSCEQLLALSRATGGVGAVINTELV